MLVGPARLEVVRSTHGIEAPSLMRRLPRDALAGEEVDEIVDIAVRARDQTSRR